MATPHLPNLYKTQSGKPICSSLPTSRGRNSWAFDAILNRLMGSAMNPQNTSRTDIPYHQQRDTILSLTPMQIIAILSTLVKSISYKLEDYRTNPRDLLRTFSLLIKRTGSVSTGRRADLATSWIRTDGCPKTSSSWAMRETRSPGTWATGIEVHLSAMPSPSWLRSKEQCLFWIPHRRLLAK